MNIPVLSVVMPVYNSATFLREAITSVLQQGFTDFECIIINDGSSDGTAQIIQSFNDPRIIYLDNEKNQGLIYSLNKGIDAARGQYIARMDGDDISLPDRFQKQVNYLQQHPGVAVLSCLTELIDEKGNSLGYWKEDKANVTPGQIRRTLPRSNCLAHPGVAGKTDVFRKYKYNRKQRNVEDYDLWLRMEADGLPIHKIGEVLLKYRVLDNSLSRQHKNVFWKNARTKRVFVAGQLAKGRLNGFIVKTMVSGISDTIMGVLKEIKRAFVRKPAG